MCGRFSLGLSAATLASHFNAQAILAWSPRYNLAPSQQVPTVVQPAAGLRELCGMRWGLIPSWAKDPTIGSRLINARAETVGEKPAFRAAFRERRCLIPADGFYEWAGAGRRKQPWCIRRSDGAPFAFAGLWERWSPPAGEPVDTCTILTTTPNALMAPIHHRMPAILDPQAYAPWLDPDLRDPGRLLPLLGPAPSEELTAYRVSLLVNRPSNDSPACLAPAE